MTTTSQTPFVSTEAAFDQAVESYLTEPVFRARREPLHEGSDLNSFPTLLREVWETVLPRELVFQSTGGDHLLLQIADRHLLGITVGSGMWVAPLEERVDEEPVRVTKNPDVATVVDTLVRFTGGSGLIRVQSSQRRFVSSGMSGGMSGLSVPLLQQHLSLAFKPAETLIDRFLALLGTLPTAVLRVSEEGQEQVFGDLEKLEMLRQSLLTEGLSDLVSDDQMIILAEGQFDTETDCMQAALIAREHGVQLLCCFDSSQALTVATIWISEKRRSG